MEVMLYTFTATLLNEVGNSFSLIISHFQDIAQAIKDDLDDLGIFHCQQVAEWRNHLLLNQVCHLFTSNPKYFIN